MRRETKRKEKESRRESRKTDGNEEGRTGEERKVRCLKSAVKCCIGNFLPRTLVGIRSSPLCPSALESSSMRTQYQTL